MKAADFSGTGEFAGIKGQSPGGGRARARARARGENGPELKKYYKMPSQRR